MLLPSVVTALSLLSLAAGVTSPGQTAPEPTSTWPPLRYRQLRWRGSPPGTDKCMAAKNKDYGSPYIVEDCACKDTQLFWDGPDVGQWVTYKNAGDPIHLAVYCFAAASISNGAKLAITSCYRWSFYASWWNPRLYGGKIEIAQGPGAYEPPTHYDYCIDVPGGDTTKDLQLWKCGNGNINQEWDWI